MLKIISVVAIALTYSFAAHAGGYLYIKNVAEHGDRAPKSDFATNYLSNSEVILSFESEGLWFEKVNAKELANQGVDIPLSFVYGDQYLGHKFDLVDSQSLQKWPVVNVAGAPSLPFLSKLILAHPDDLKVEVSHYIVKELYSESDLIELGEGEVYPLPGLVWPCRCSKVPYRPGAQWVGKDINNSNYGLNSQAHSINDIYKVEFLGYWQGFPISRIIFQPIQSYNDALYFYHQVEMSFSHVSGENIMVGKNEIISSLKNGIESKSTSSRMLILTFEEQEYYKDYKRFREKSGLEVRLFDLYKLFLNYPPERDLSFNEYREDFESIRVSLKALYEEWQYGHVLIFGSEEEVPTDYVVTTFDRNTPSDKEYFLFTEDSYEDRIPDVYYSRYVANSEEDIYGLMERVETFEQNFLSISPSRYLGIASNEGFNPTDWEYINQMAKPFHELGLETVLVHEDDYDYSSIPFINQTLGNGVLWMNYIGHGIGPAWNSIGQRDYEYTDIQEIRHTHQRPLIVDVACQNGRFSRDQRLGVHFMNEVNADFDVIGASGYYGGSVDITWHPPAIMAVGINQYLSKMMKKDNLGRTLRLGEVLMAGQLYLMENHFNYREVIENLSWYHLIGDSSTVLRY